MKSVVGLTLALAVVACAVPLTATANSRHHDRAWRGDIHRFEAHDLHRWRSGTWRHGRHAGPGGGGLLVAAGIFIHGRSILILTLSGRQVLLWKHCLRPSLSRFPTRSHWPIRRWSNLRQLRFSSGTTVMRLRAITPMSQHAPAAGKLYQPIPKEFLSEPSHPSLGPCCAPCVSVGVDRLRRRAPG